MTYKGTYPMEQTPFGNKRSYKAAVDASDDETSTLTLISGLSSLSGCVVGNVLQKHPTLTEVGTLNISNHLFLYC